MSYIMREARIEDIESITNIYNQGIKDRIDTLETRLRDIDEMKEWLTTRSARYKVVVIEDCESIVRGWAYFNVKFMLNFRKWVVEYNIIVYHMIIIEYDNMKEGTFWI